MPANVACPGKMVFEGSSCQLGERAEPVSVPLIQCPPGTCSQGSLSGGEGQGVKKEREMLGK